jgi:nucleoside 2-deoxyribosyltransferase
MIVVGGTYREVCVDPPFDSLRGSGLRAAAALRRHATIKLRSAIDDLEHVEAEVIAGGLDLDVEWAKRNESVRFTYFTPVSPPTIDGRMATIAQPLSAEDDAVLVFGMVECPLRDVTISARRVVIDPQQPRDLTELELTTITAGERAIVANARETKALGRSQDVRTAAVNLMREYRVDVVVTKLAARGALVTTKSDQELVGAYATKTVWPIGSGDVFAAAFALEWAEHGQDPVSAAKGASRAAARWCSTRRDDFDIASPSEVAGEEVDPSRIARVYLASPFQTLPQRWLVHLARDVLQGLGSDVFSPFHDVGPGGPEVAEKDLAGLRNCSAVFAVLDGSDPGTVFEAGFATARGLPVVCYAEHEETEVWKMLAGTGAQFHTDFSSGLYHAVWAGMKHEG